MEDRFGEILTEEALDFVAGLHSQFAGRRADLLAISRSRNDQERPFCAKFAQRSRSFASRSARPRIASRSHRHRSPSLLRTCCRRGLPLHPVLKCDQDHNVPLTHVVAKILGHLWNEWPEQPGRWPISVWMTASASLALHTLASDRPGRGRAAQRALAVLSRTLRSWGGAAASAESPS